jgi:hypothetical protein
MTLPVTLMIQRSEPQARGKVYQQALRTPTLVVLRQSLPFHRCPIWPVLAKAKTN